MIKDNNGVPLRVLKIITWKEFFETKLIKSVALDIFRSHSHTFATENNRRGNNLCNL